MADDHEGIEPHQLDAPDPESYRPPILETLGTLAELTQGGAGSGADTGFGFGSSGGL